MPDKYFDVVYHVYYSSRVVDENLFSASLIRKNILDKASLLYLSSEVTKVDSPDFFKGKPLVKALDKLVHRLAKQVAFNRFEICHAKIIVHKNPTCDIQDGYTQSWMTYFHNQFPLMALNEEAYPEEVSEMLEKHLDDLVSDYDNQGKEETDGESTVASSNPE